MIPFKYICLLVTLLSLNSYSQTNFVTYNSEKFDLSFDLPSNDVFYNSDDKSDYYSEQYYNEAEDFELDLTKYIGNNTYQENIDFDREIGLISKDYEWSNFSTFLEKEIKPGVYSKFAISYSVQDECTVIFGSIHNKNLKIIYDIILYCYNISVYDGAIIIDSLN